MKTLAIIPARYESTRFPGKLLALLGGKPVLQWVWERAQSAQSIDKVIIATDNKKIMEAGSHWGAEVMMTRAEHQTGTDRCIEIAQKFPEYDLIVNVQGDEPFLEPRDIDNLVTLMKNGVDYQVGTLCLRIQSEEEVANPNVVKLVKAGNRAHYFSRSPIPFLRDKGKTLIVTNPKVSPKASAERSRSAVTERSRSAVTEQNYYQHIGIYAFKRDSLLSILKMPIGLWEQMEKLEQLRWLEAGYTFGVLEVENKSIGIDTPEDLEAAERMLDS